jgi:hypothetical protein
MLMANASATVAGVDPGAMKTKELIVLVSAVVFAACTGLAQSSGRSDWWSRGSTPNRTSQYFAAEEISIDAFATYLAAQSKFSELFQTDIRDGTWGGGLGLNYYFSRFFGIGADVNLPDNRGALVDSVTANVMARLPIDKIRLAPYIFAGGGRTTDQVWQWEKQAGVGLEYRLDPMTGIFIDGRYVWPDKTSDNLLLRAGLRLAF